MFLMSEYLKNVPGVLHGFGTLEEPLPHIVSTTWESNRPQWQQVHGDSVAQVCAPGEDCGSVDALFTSLFQVPIAVKTADCVPILVAHQSGEIIGAVHSGWRGTKKRILFRLWEKLKTFDPRPSHWIGAIGPSIGPCCYEVSEDLAEEFKKEFTDIGSNIAVPHHRVLDLPAIQNQFLKQIGFEKIDLLRNCTRCSTNPKFHSYRREGGGTRQWSVIIRTV